LTGIPGISEETTTGVNRLYAMKRDGSLKALAINAARNTFVPLPFPGCTNQPAETVG
jgi:hypothetical protein